MCKDLNTTNQRVKSLPHLLFVLHLTGSHFLSPRQFSFLLHWRKNSCQKWPFPWSFSLIGAFGVWVTYFESKPWCLWVTNTTLLKQSNIVQSRVDIILINGIIHTKDSETFQAQHDQLCVHGGQSSIKEVVNFRNKAGLNLIITEIETETGYTHEDFLIWNFPVDQDVWTDLR